MQEVKVTQKQELLYVKKPFNNSSVTPAECYVCGKGLDNGYSVTAKRLPGGIALFCDIHYSLQ